MISRKTLFQADDVSLFGQIYLPNGAGPHPTVCICHGIPNSRPDASLSISDRGYHGLAERVCREGLAALIFNFRGTGASGGNFDILGWTRDLGAALDYVWALAEVDRRRLFLLGFSGGAAVSVCVTAQDKRVAAVAACACPAEFASFLKEPGQPQSFIEHFREIGIIRDEDFPPSLEVWLDDFKSVSPVSYVDRISPRPLLLVHGDRDETVDVSHARRLYAQAGEPRQLVIIEGAGHGLRQDERAMATTIDWLHSQARDNA